VRDEYTTLKDTQERIMSTKVFCEYFFKPSKNIEELDFNGIYEGVLKVRSENF
jgi:urate oxidase